MFSRGNRLLRSAGSFPITNKMQGSRDLTRGFRTICAGTAQPNQRSRNFRSFDPPFHDRDAAVNGIPAGQFKGSEKKQGLTWVLRYQVNGVEQTSLRRTISECKGETFRASTVRHGSRSLSIRLTCFARTLHLTYRRGKIPSTSKRALALPEEKIPSGEPNRDPVGNNDDQSSVTREGCGAFFIFSTKGEHR